MLSWGVVQKRGGSGHTRAAPSQRLMGNRAMKLRPLPACEAVAATVAAPTTARRYQAATETAAIGTAQHSTHRHSVQFDSRPRTQGNGAACVARNRALTPASSAKQRGMHVVGVLVEAPAA